MSINHDQTKDFMDTLRDNMFDDVQRAINANANYLAALGLSTYTEHLGGLYRGDLRHGNSEKNYTEFIMDFFPGTLYNLANTALKDLGGLYKVVRCGLVHEYFMKIDSTVTMGSSNSSNNTPKCGITYDPTHAPALEFNVDQYYVDFKSVFQKYYDELIGTANLRMKPIREGYFYNAINTMPFKPFYKTNASSPPRFQGASGSSSSFTVKGSP